MTILPPDAALRLAAIVQSSDDAIVSKDLTGTITSWNAGAERLFGYTAVEAIGRPVRMLIPSDRQDEEDRILESVRTGHVVAPFDTLRGTKGGRLIDVSVAVSPIYDERGQIVGASTITRDISARKRMEGELHELQQRLMTLVAASGSILASPDVDSVLSASLEVARGAFAADGYAVWRVGAEGAWTIVRSAGVSDEFARRVAGSSGESATDVVPFTEPLVVEDVTAEPLVAHLRDEYARAGVASMIVYPLTVRGARTATMVFYSRARQRYRDIDVRVGGALANLVGASLTAAELYQQEQRLRAESERAQRQAAFLAEAGAVLASSLDYEDTLARVARLAVPAIGDWCAVDVLDDRNRLQRLAVAHVDPAKVALAQALQERYPADPEAPHGVHAALRTGSPTFMSIIPKALVEASARDDEHRRLLETLNLASYMCVPLLAHGRAFGVLTFVSSESGREYTEADVRFAQELAARASLAVENARAYDRAREANRLKDEFLATLSHELRTPLNAVLGYARMLRLGTIAPARAASALEVIERNATSLRQIIEDVLDVSRIVAGRLRLNVEPVDLPAILHDALATVMPAATAKGVNLEAVIDPISASVSGDSDRLQQIVWNVLSNAIKFTPRGGKVQLRLTRVNSHVEITVSDTGQGIDPAFLPYVFEHFRQADATFAREHGGLGLGLGIAKQLTELHGGRIAAHSDGPGRGATFVVSLPLMIVHERAAAGRRDHPSSDRQAPGMDAAPSLHGIHVLAVDDEEDSLRLLQAALEQSGARVTTAASAAAAIELLRARVPDVLIADIGMPDMDGLQLIRAVRQMEAPVRQVPAAALTAYARPQDRVTSLASGFQMHLVKPIDPVELVVAVAALAPRRAGA